LANVVVVVVHTRQVALVDGACHVGDNRLVVAFEKRYASLVVVVVGVVVVVVVVVGGAARSRLAWCWTQT
jgi:hypothetical protein